MPNFENLPMNPWLLAGTAVAIITVIFYIGKWVGDINAFKSGAVGKVVDLLEEIRDDIRTLLDRVPAVHIARGSPLRLTGLEKLCTSPSERPPPENLRFSDSPQEGGVIGGSHAQHQWVAGRGE